MVNVFRKWIDYYFADEEAVALLVLLASALLLILFMGDVGAPVLASIIIAYFLQGLVGKLKRVVSHIWAVIITFVFFLGLFLMLAFLALPMIGKQLMALTAELPGIAVTSQSLLLGLQQEYPALLAQDQLQKMIDLISERLAGLGQMLVSFSLATIPSVIAILIYGVLIPLMVFFFLKDKDQILSWLARFLPHERPLMRQIWQEMNVQVANYARGKAVEVLIVTVATLIAFGFLGQNYAVLLAVLVGLSVIVPYIGAALVTIPVAVIGFFQWGWSEQFAYVMAAYGVIQFLDGNVVVPLLFSEAVSLHPLAIIISVLFFGGMWGMWGVFFAIPLATLVNALIESWPAPVVKANSSVSVE
ncbi:MAG: AI-2E family transporter [Pseudomonadales bacterium]|nr:AI-2E family transporter [Pseudomonadales bacterium]